MSNDKTKANYSKSKFSNLEFKNNSKSSQDKSKNRFNHTFKKSLGQNFLSDTNLLSAIQHDANTSKIDYVVEVGAGQGSLTKILVENSAFVLSFEVDNDLKETLYNLQDQYKNLNIQFIDILKSDISTIHKILSENGFNKGQDKYKVVANIPYYITSEIIFKFLDDIQNIKSITVLVQKEVAERVVATSGSEYGILSVLISFFGTPKIKRIVGRRNFYPVPNVDSAVLHIEIDKSNDKELYPFFKEIVHICFNYRRKTILNNLSARLNIDKDKLTDIITGLNLKPTLRAENLSLEDYIKLSKVLKSELNK